MNTQIKQDSVYNSIPMSLDHQNLEVTSKNVYIILTVFLDTAIVGRGVKFSPQIYLFNFAKCEISRGTRR